MYFGKTVIPGILNDSKAAKDLIAKLPYTVEMSRYSHDFCGVMDEPLEYDKKDVHYGCGYCIGNEQYPYGVFAAGSGNLCDLHPPAELCHYAVQRHEQRGDLHHCIQLWRKRERTYYGHIMEMGIRALRFIAAALLLTTTTQILSGFLQAMGQGTASFLVSISQAVFLLLFAWIFAQTGSTTLVWLAFPAMEIIRFAIAAVMVRWTYQGKIVKLQAAQVG